MNPDYPGSVINLVESSVPRDLPRSLFKSFLFKVYSKRKIKWKLRRQSGELVACVKMCVSTSNHPNEQSGDPKPKNQQVERERH